MLDTPAPRNVGVADEGRTMATETFQITPQQAELYEERFVPALFAHWVDAVLDAAGVRAGQDVLDVACGTGVVARHAVGRVGAAGSVTGLDLNQAMLDVAARVSSQVTWKRGDVAALPFDDGSFDVVTCQSAAMFFPDPTGALREMARVTRPGGTVAVQVFDLREHQPAYGPWIDMVVRHAGEDALRMLGTYWVHGDRDVMRRRCAAAGLRVTAVRDHQRPAYFPSVEAMVRTEVGATPLADRLTAAELDAIIADSYRVYEPFRLEGSEQLTIPLAGYVLVATPDSHAAVEVAAVETAAVEAAAVEAVVRDYIDAWHAGDAQRMDRSLHDDLVKRTVDSSSPAPGGLSPVTKARMVELTRGGGGASSGAHADVVVHHVEAEIASAQVATGEYLDYLHLAKVGGAWRIVHDLFRSRG